MQTKVILQMIIHLTQLTNKGQISVSDIRVGWSTKPTNIQNLADMKDYWTHGHSPHTPTPQKNLELLLISRLFFKESSRKA